MANQHSIGASAEDVRIPDWADIDPRARLPPQPANALPKEYLDYLSAQNIHFSSRLGTGSFASVWLSRITVTDPNQVSVTKTMACKVLPLYYYRRMSLVQACSKIVNEANLMRELDHQHVVKCELIMHVEDMSEMQSHFPYMYVLIFMDLCDQDLQSYLMRINRTMTETETYNWFVQMADGLRYLHDDQRVAHMDIKPKNILIKYEPNRENYATMKLTDFGVAQRYDEAEMTAVRRGSNRYMAPEVMARTPYDPYRADVYSLGLTLAETLSGFNLAVRDDMVSDINVRLNDSLNFAHFDHNFVSGKWNISINLLHLLNGMLARDPTQRFDISRVWSSEWVCQRPYLSGVAFYLPPN